MRKKKLKNRIISDVAEYTPVEAGSAAGGSSLPALSAPETESAQESVTDTVLRTDAEAGTASSELHKQEDEPASSASDHEYTEQEDHPGMKNIYILLSRTGTVPSKVIRFLKPMPYAHASIAFDENLTEMYSFARKKVHYPFYCGLIDEDIDKGVFAKKKTTKCLVLRLPVTEEEYGRVHENVEKFKEHRRRYGYNYLGVFAARAHIAIERKYNYFCTQFVDKVLQMSGIDLFGKKPGLVTPDDYRTSDKLEHFYEGLLVNYRNWLSSLHLDAEEKSLRKSEKKELKNQRKLLKTQQKEQQKHHKEQQKFLRAQQKEQQKELRDQQKEQQQELREQMLGQQLELNEQQRAEQHTLIRAQHRAIRKKQAEIDRQQLERKQERQLLEGASSDGTDDSATTV